MKVFFTASLTGKKQYEEKYINIVNTIRNLGHSIKAEHILDVNEEDVDRGSEEVRLKFHKKLEKWIQECDFVVVEASFASISVGYEVSLAMQYGKPVLVLYSKGYPPALFAYHENEKLVCERYSDDRLKDILKDFTSYVKGVNDTRFTFYITSEIASFLERISKKKKIPKSVYLRQLIEKEIRTSR